MASKTVKAKTKTDKSTPAFPLTRIPELLSTHAPTPRPSITSKNDKPSDNNQQSNNDKEQDNTVASTTAASHSNVSVSSGDDLPFPEFDRPYNTSNNNNQTTAASRVIFNNNRNNINNNNNNTQFARTMSLLQHNATTTISGRITGSDASASNTEDDENKDNSDSNNATATRSLQPSSGGINVTATTSCLF